ncbi:hypothetical protein KCU64_g16141, partial [Aureobasidium melanogenum]
MDITPAQDQLCALVSQFTSLAGLGDHSDPQLQRHLAIRITDVIRRELVQRGAIQPDHPPTIWEGGLRLDLLEQPANDTLNPATTEDEEIAMRTEAMPDRMETDEEDITMPEKADQTYVASNKWRGRRRNYYRCLSWLRSHGHSWVFMVNVRNLDSPFGSISDPETTFGPWIELFGSFPAGLSSRAFSRAKGDYSGRREMRLFENIPQIERDEWNDYRVKYLAERVAFDSDIKRRPSIELPSVEATLKYGYRGFRDDNYSWSITIRDDGTGGLGAFSTVPIKAGSFIGFLPGYCRFNPEKENRMELKGFIESHLLGLFFEDQDCCGLLSYMERTNLGAEGNVIGGWEQYNDDMGQNSMPWCIVVFAYRDIPVLTPLVFWDHMRFD